MVYITPEFATVAQNILLDLDDKVGKYSFSHTKVLIFL